MNPWLAYFLGIATALAPSLAVAATLLWRAHRMEKRHHEMPSRSAGR